MQTCFPIKQILAALLFCTPCFAQENNNSSSKPKHCYDSTSWAGTTADCFKEEDLPSTTFSPTKGVEVTVAFKGISDTSSTNGTGAAGSFIKFTPVYTITSNGSKIYVETTNEWEGDSVPKAIIIEDYNFDGLMDFSVLQYDGGMVIHDVYRVFTYSKELNRFLEHHTDDGLFVNLVVDKKKKRLLYTCWESISPMPKQCATRLSNKTVITPKKNESP